MNKEQWVCCDVCMNPNAMDAIECHACETWLLGKTLQLYEDVGNGTIELSSETIFHDLKE